MPRLPTAEVLGERPTARPNPAVVSYRPAGGGEAPGLALAQAGRQLQGVGDEIYRLQQIEQERADKVIAQDAINQLHAAEQELTLGEKGFTKRRGADAVKTPLVSEYEGRFSEASKLIKGQLKNDRQRALFDMGAAPIASRLRGNAFKHVDREYDAYSKAVFENTKATALQTIASNFNNPLSVANAINGVNRAIDLEADRLGLPDLKEREKQSFLDLALRSQVEAQRLVDPVGALTTFQENAEKMSPSVRQTVGEAIFRDAAPVLASQIISGPLKTVAVNRDEALAIGRIANAMGQQFEVKVDPNHKGETVFDRLPGDQKLRVLALAATQANQGMAQVREAMGYRVQDATEALERGMAPSDVPSRDELIRAFGPERGSRVAQSLDTSRSFGEDVQRVVTMAPQEIMGLLESRKPQPGQGFALEQQRFDQLSGAVSRVLSERQKDPAAFAIQHAPAVNQALSALQANQTPETAQAFAVSMLAEQKRLGIEEPKLLPKYMADGLTRQFSDLSGGPQQVTQLIQSQAQTWGPFWPQVYKQIAKDIGPTARVVANLRDTPAAALLSMNAKLKTSELKEGIPATAAKDVNDAIEVELEPFKKSLVGWTTGGSGTYNDFDEAARRNAYVYVAQGLKPKEAAVRASRELVGEYYEFLGNARIPIAPGIDVRSVDVGMASVLRDADKLGVRIPEQEAKVLGPEFVGKQLGISVKNNGFFVTLPDDSGVALFMQGANGARAIEGQDGRPITFTWRQLMDRAIESRKSSPLQFQDTEGGAATGATRQRKGAY